LSKPEEAKGSKKKKQKVDEISTFSKFVENLNLKIFEEKYETTDD
jgi:hypothetical protein